MQLDTLASTSLRRAKGLSLVVLAFRCDMDSLNGTVNPISVATGVQGLGLTMWMYGVDPRSTYQCVLIDTGAYESRGTSSVLLRRWLSFSLKGLNPFDCTAVVLNVSDLSCPWCCYH